MVRPEQEEKAPVPMEVTLFGMLTLASAGLSIGIQSLQIANDPKLREQCAVATRKQLKEYLHAQGIELPEEPEKKPEEAADARAGDLQAAGVPG